MSLSNIRKKAKQKPPSCLYGGSGVGKHLLQQYEQANFILLKMAWVR